MDPSADLPASGAEPASIHKLPARSRLVHFGTSGGTSVPADNLVGINPQERFDPPATGLILERLQSLAKIPRISKSRFPLLRTGVSGRRRFHRLPHTLSGQPLDYRLRRARPAASATLWEPAAAGRVNPGGKLKGMGLDFAWRLLVSRAGSVIENRLRRPRPRLLARRDRIPTHGSELVRRFRCRFACAFMTHAARRAAWWAPVATEDFWHRQRWVMAA